MNTKYRFIEAFKSLKSNFLRALLTISIIAIGITCLVGILTSVDSILFSMKDSFTSLGTNSFEIRPANDEVSSRRDGRQEKKAEPISFQEATAFRDAFIQQAPFTSISARSSSNGLIKWGEEQTNPTASIQGIDEHYLQVTSFKILEGRNFNANEIENASLKAVIGNDIVKKLFRGSHQWALNKRILVNGKQYLVIGTLESKGSALGRGQDEVVFIPVTRSYVDYGTERTNYKVSVTVGEITQLSSTVNNAIGVMRNVRRLQAVENNDFEIRTSESLLERLKTMTAALRIGSFGIAIMTLLGASIGLMNIMLVSVSERTREIGIRKALGAKSKDILIQFILEAVIICLIGGFLGVVLGVFIGYGVAQITKVMFMMPWAWVILALVISVIVGLLSGLYPAVIASKLDPIESLRYE